MGGSLAIVLGLGVGLSLGALGGGGSTLAFPILVFIAGTSAHSATSASLLVVGVASAIGSIRHHRLGNVRLGVGLAFGAAGLVGSRVGTTLNRSLPEKALLLAFAILILAVAVRMFVGADAISDAADDADADETQGGGATLVVTRSRTTIDVSVAGAVRLGLAATGVGLLTGLFGVGGGFAVVPALTLLLGFGTREAIGTSLVVITMNAAIALTLRAGSLDLDWALVAPFLGTVTAGVLGGSHIASGLDPDRLARAFAAMLTLVGVYTALTTLL